MMRKALISSVATTVILLALYAWALSDTIVVTIRIQRDTLTAAINGYSVAAVDSQFPEGQTGLYLEEPLSPSADVPLPFGLRVPGAWTRNLDLFNSGLSSAWHSVTVTPLEGGTSWSAPSWNGDDTNLVGEWRPATTSIRTLGGKTERDYTVVGRLARGKERAGIAVRLQDPSRGYLFWFRPEEEDMGWDLLDGGRRRELKAGGFRLTFSQALKGVLRELLPAYFYALILAAAAFFLAFLLSHGAGLFPIRLPARARSLILDVIKWLPLFVSIGATVVAALVATFLLERIPHVQDSVAYLFQAKTLALGRLSVPSPPYPEFFAHEFIINRDGQWFSKYPPGHPLVLTLGVLLRAPWLVAPVLGGVSLGLIYLVGRTVYRPQVGLLAAFLGLVSPLFIFMSGSFMSHPTAMFFIALFLLAFGKTVLGGRWWWPAVAGLAIGWVFMTRPLTAIGLSPPFILYGLYRILKEKNLRPWLVMALSAAAPVAFWLTYNYVFTGNPLRSTMELWWSFDRIGFGDDVGMRGGHTPAEGLVNTRRNLTSLLVHLFGWPDYLTLALALLPFALGRSNLWDRLLLGSFLSLMAGYVFYWADGVMYGPRYYYESLPMLLLLTARGASLLPGSQIPLSASGGPQRRRLAGQWAAGLILLTLVTNNLAFYMPTQLKIYQGYNYVNGAIFKAVAAKVRGPALIFVEHEPEWQWWRYGSAFSSNEPLLDSAVIYARDLGEAKNRQLMALYPQRKYFLWKGSALSPYPQPPATAGTMLTSSPASREVANP